MAAPIKRRKATPPDTDPLTDADFDGVDLVPKIKVKAKRKRTPKPKPKAPPKIPEAAPPQLPLTPDENTAALKATFGGQHSLHGMFASSLERIGGQDFIDEWARNNPTTFMEMMLKLAPPPAPAGGGGGGGGKLELHIHPGLQAGDLDRGLTIDQ